MLCRICARPIVILIRQGTGICCNQCERISKNEMPADEIMPFIKSVNPAQYLRAMEKMNATEA